MIINTFRRLAPLVYLMGYLWSNQATVTGIIVDSLNQTVIHGAEVYLEKQNIGTTSQMNGQFTLSQCPYGQIQIKISMIGFKDVTKSILIKNNRHDLGIVSILKDTITIKEVVVDAHYQLRPKEFLSNIHLSGGRLQENLKSTLAMTLEQEAGVSVQTMGQAVSKPVSRGYTGDRFLLTENGITTGDLSNTAIDHAISFDMISFNSAQIIRGPEILLYGSNTVGGVIDVSRQSSLDLRFNKFRYLTLIGAESSNNGSFGNFIVYLPINAQHQFKISILDRYAGDQRSPLGLLDNTSLSNGELTASYSYFGRSHRTTVSYENLEMDYGLPGSPEGHINGVDLKMSKNSQKLNHHRDISFLNFQTFDIDQRYINYNHSEYVTGSNSASVSMGQNLFSLQGKLTGDQLTLGSLIQYRDFRAGGFYWTPDTEETRFSVFGLFQRNINKTVLQISSRLEYLTIDPETSFLFMSNLNEEEIVKRDFTILCGSVGLIRSWSNLEVSLATMITGRTPDLDELYSDGPHLGTYSYEIGQPNLTLERTISFEGSLQYNTSKSEISLTGYHNLSPNYHISTAQGLGYEPGADWIEWGSGSSGWLYKYQMKGLRARIYGWESEMRYELNNWFNLNGNVSVTRGENLSQDRPLEYMPPDKIQFSPEINFGSTSLSLNLKKVFAQKRLGEFETRTDGYSILGINGSYTIRTAKVSHKFILQISNVFDQVYYNHLSRIKTVMPEDGRSLNIQYRVVF